ncbi:Thermostable monoacylglycerol lipase [Falsiruegeria litorea R37]|uniref:Thermostable monoacylglycerol lipase n=1 Tax=Falsiruegeria litorea R37 TaxID=1200284 RepID=A0A1Y5T757_9RHOB|nr:alpha/beta hydrolase [Falsiruegeria litorea]SLN57417.1 Thermostable monoacylglycerol lipase [Falsiruegeria litorea R37]
MRALGKLLGRLLLILVVVGAGLWIFGPREEVNLNPTFEPRKFGEGVQVYFESIESSFDDIVPGTEKRVIWQEGAKEQRTQYSVLYIHGFSASSEEIRPVPDRIADALGANLVYTRLQGHGRGSDAMVEGTAVGWMQDTAEALSAARAVGDKVVVISTSTGGTLAAAAALDPNLSADVAAMIFVSPNFGVNAPMAWIPGLPGARIWLPPLMGGTRNPPTGHEAKDMYWSTNYSWEAVVPLTALLQEVVVQDFSAAKVPALFRFSDDDKVVRSDLSRQIAAQWGGAVELQPVTVGPGDDPSAHVIAGDIESPGLTDQTVQDTLAWLKSLGIE